MRRRLPALLAGAALLASTQTLAEAPVVRQGATAAQDLETRLTRVERVVSGQGLLDLLNQVERLNREVKQLRGEIDSQAYEMQRLRQDNRALTDELATLRSGLAGMAPGLASGGVPGGLLPGAAGAVTAPGAAADTGPVDAPATAAGAATVAPPPEQPVTLPPGSVEEAEQLMGGPVSPERPVPEPVVPPDAPVAPPVATAAPAPAEEAALYRDAFSLLKAGQYDAAITGFQGYLASYPQGPNADNAQYWIGEAHHVNRRFDAAITEYRKLIASYPQSAKLTHAKLKVGDCLHELGRKDEAEAELQALIAEHPTTTAARLAEERLERWRLSRG